jgi:hypothetical protein
LINSVWCSTSLSASEPHACMQQLWLKRSLFPWFMLFANGSRCLERGTRNARHGHARLLAIDALTRSPLPLPLRGGSPCRTGARVAVWASSINGLCFYFGAAFAGVGTRSKLLLCQAMLLFLSLAGKICVGLKH